MTRGQLRCALVGLLLAPTSFAQDATLPSNTASASSPEQVCLSEILIPTTKSDTRALVNEAKRKAMQVRNAVRLGCGFADLARANSKGQSANHGGGIGCFMRGTLAQPYDDVFRMKVGEISDVLRTNQGFVILQVTEREPKPALESTQQNIQNAHASGVRGRVVDRVQHVPIRNAYVLAHGVGGVDIHVRTDTAGTYAIPLPVGIYDVFISANGFSPASRKVEVTPDGMMIFDTSLDFNGLGMENVSAMR
jgi:PPIC-type PPIASE domain/Carboxypeptidase regulatory-like domain